MRGRNILVESSSPRQQDTGANPSELSPKFNCCKMEYLFILRFKGPLRFSMFGTCLSFKQFWLSFSQGLTSLWLLGSFLEALYFCLRSCKALFNRFLSIRCSTVTLRGGACMFLQVEDGVSDFATYA